jgi:hypothetical protein
MFINAYSKNYIEYYLVVYIYVQMRTGLKKLSKWKLEKIKNY